MTIKTVEDLFDFQLNRVYMVFAIARSKNNAGLTAKHQIVFREPVNSLEKFRKAVDRLRAITQIDPENRYYIYVSVNSRNTVKGYALLKKLMADYDSSAMFGKTDHLPKLDRIHKEWYSALMKPSSKGSRYFLVDIDTEDPATLDTVRQIVNSFAYKDYKAEVLLEQKTRNGWHFVCTPFNTKLLVGISNVDVKDDGLLYLECVNF